MSESLRPHGLYSPWNSPGQNAGVGSLSLLRGSSQPRDQTFTARSPTLQADSLPAESQGEMKTCGFYPRVENPLDRGAWNLKESDMTEAA